MDRPEPGAAPEDIVKSFIDAAASTRPGHPVAREHLTEDAAGSWNDETGITKFQIGAAGFIAPKTQLLATWGRDIKVDNGFKESSRLNLRLLQLF